MSKNAISTNVIIIPKAYKTGNIHKIDITNIITTKDVTIAHTIIFLLLAFKQYISPKIKCAAKTTSSVIANVSSTI